MKHTITSPDNRYAVEVRQTINHWLLSANFGHEDEVSNLFTARIEARCKIVSMSVSAHARTYKLLITKGQVQNLITELPEIMAECLCSAQEKS